MKMETENSPLAGIQNWMQHALIHPEDPASTAAAAEVLLPSNTLSPRERLAIYQRGYYARLVQCMEGQFKVLCRTLGKDLFTDFAGNYLREHPSASPTLSELGNRFPDFLRRTRPDLENPEREIWVDFMIDLAQFEWDLYQVFDAEGQEGKSYADLTADDERLDLQPALFLKTYGFPLSGYYTAIAGGREADMPDPTPQYVAFCRKDYVIGIFTLLPPQYFFLEKVQEGFTIPDALGLTAKKFDSPPEKALAAWQEWKRRWVKAGFFKVRPATTR